MSSDVPHTLLEIVRLKKTGQLILEAAARQSVLMFESGNWVGLRTGFGYQTTAQCLAIDGDLDLPALDSAWFDNRPLSKGVSIQPLRRLCQLAQSSHFQEGAVESQFASVEGELVAKEAFRALGVEYPQALRTPWDDVHDELAQTILDLTADDIVTAEADESVEVEVDEQWPFQEESERASIQAVSAFAHGQVALKRRDFRGAEALFQSAYAQEPKAEYLAAQGWSVYSDPFRPEEHHYAMQRVTESLKIDPQCYSALYYLGLVAELDGLDDQAESYFSSVVHLAPTHLEARQALRAIQTKKMPNKIIGKSVKST